MAVTARSAAALRSVGGSSASRLVCSGAPRRSSTAARPTKTAGASAQTRASRTLFTGEQPAFFVRGRLRGARVAELHVRGVAVFLGDAHAFHELAAVELDRLHEVADRAAARDEGQAPALAVDARLCLEPVVQGFRVALEHGAQDTPDA